SLSEPVHLESLNFYSTLLALRKKEIVPLLQANQDVHPRIAHSTIDSRGLRVCWKLGTRNLRLLANLTNGCAALEPIDGRLLYTTFNAVEALQTPPWSVSWYLG